MSAKSKTCLGFDGFLDMHKQSCGVIAASLTFAWRIQMLKPNPISTNMGTSMGAMHTWIWGKYLQELLEASEPKSFN
ncbi:hypothetical protein H8S90_03920 [Olivibacter sp. SDN3]|uniref:hypothetical protein n=1 Tax=Olivibacter sp. SDN3 TaxID=2764720 RepID=UPI0016513A51|nr:hypothetical protein [Olivibacter sp. SDN3]QNL50753.1 hypothetical protein H8S90_03920 [Olivibacter sp. SDN3]